MLKHYPAMAIMITLVALAIVSPFVFPAKQTTERPVYKQYLTVSSRPTEGSRCKVRVFYNTTTTEEFGRIVRADASSPYITIIRLDSGKFILGSECEFYSY